MLDIKYIVAHPDEVKRRLSLRKPELAAQIDGVLTKYSVYKTVLARVEELRAKRNEMSKSIGKIKKEQGDEAAKEAMADGTMISTSNIIFLVCIGIAAVYCAANALILWWRQPSKEDAENDDAADTPDGTDTDTADAEGSEDDTDDDVETDVATTDADASPTTNRQ